MNEAQEPKDGRTRTWAMVVYPDSVPENWKEILQEQHVPVLISPLHDCDKNADGEPKKPHWHVLLMYNGKKSRKQIDELAEDLNAPRPQPVSDKRGYARYLIHADNPEKFQYDARDVTALGGADFTQFILGAADTDTALGEMMDWCVDQGCYSFYRLSLYARDNRPDWFRVITSCRTVFLVNWLKSMQWEVQQGIEIGSCPQGGGQGAERPTTTLPLGVVGHWSNPRSEDCGSSQNVSESTTDQHGSTRINTEINTDQHAPTCPFCDSSEVRKVGKTASGQQRYQCKQCGKTSITMF